MCLSCYLPYCMTGMPALAILLIMGVGTLATGIAANYARKGRQNSCNEPSATPCMADIMNGPNAAPCGNPQRCPIKVTILRSKAGHPCKGILKKTPRRYSGCNQQCPARATFCAGPPQGNAGGCPLCNANTC